MPDSNRAGRPGERNPNEAQDVHGSTQGTEPGTGDATEGIPAGPAPTNPSTDTGTTGPTSTGGRR